MDKNLTAFIAISETGNLTIAADKIGLTQPSLTKRLNNLEEEFGCKLFIRHRRGMSLTPAGDRFYLRARRIEQELLQASEELRCLEEAGLDVLRVGAGPLFHQQYMAPVFSKLRLKYPDLRLELDVGTNERTLPMLMKGQLDVVCGVIQATEPHGALLVIPMTTIEHGLVIRRDKNLPEKRKMRPEQLKDMQWVLYSHGRDMEDWMNAYFSIHNIGKPDIVVRTASFATGLGLVREAGFAMIVPVQLAPMIETAELQVVSAEPSITYLNSGTYVRPSSMGFPAIKSFVELMSQEFEASR